MRILVNNVRLFVDVEGAALVADGPVMRRKPTLIVLHGGPGADHSIYKPAFSQLSDLAQIIYVDHRGNGRSEDGETDTWNLDQWGDDIAALCDVLEIEKPIVFGASFGGFVAQSFATRHPNRPAAMIFAATTPKVDFDVIFEAFERIAGVHAGKVARAYWSAPSPERRQAYFEHCLPHYSVTSPDPDMMARLIVKNPVALHFNGPDKEMGRFDFSAALSTVRCPCLILSGDKDPMMPDIFAQSLKQSLTQAKTQHFCLPDAGHMLSNDLPEAFFDHLRLFITETSQCD